MSEDSGRKDREWVISIRVGHEWWYILSIPTTIHRQLYQCIHPPSTILLLHRSQALLFTLHTILPFWHSYSRCSPSLCLQPFILLERPTDCSCSNSRVAIVREDVAPGEGHFDGGLILLAKGRLHADVGRVDCSARIGGWFCVCANDLADIIFESACNPNGALGNSETWLLIWLTIQSRHSHHH